METVAENPSSLERRLDLSVSSAELKAGTTERLKHLGRTAKIPGFRPGKIPHSLLEQKYGQEAHREVLSDLLDKLFYEAVSGQKLRVAGYPRLEPKISQNQGELLEFTAIFEVYPEIKLGDLSEAEVERPCLEIGEAEIEKTLDILRKQRVSYVDVSRPAAKEDRVVIDFLGKKDGEPFQGGQAADYPFVLGRGTMLPDFEKAVEGAVAGEYKAFDLVFPSDYFAKDLAGQTVQFEVTVKVVQEPKLPEVNAEFARMLGVVDGDVGKMRAEVESNLRREVKKRIETRTKDQVMEALLKANPVDVPKYLLDMEVQRLAQAAREDMEQRGMKTKDVPIRQEWFVDQAKRRVSLGLILAEVVKSEKLEAKSEQVRSMIEEAAQGYDNPSEVLEWYFSKSDRLNDVEAMVVENNVVDWVLGKVKVKDEPVSFETLMGGQ